MTHHPRRARDDDEPSIEEIAAQAVEPVAAELRGKLETQGRIPPQGSAKVPAHTSNGVPPGLRPNAAKLIGQAVAETLAETLPQAMYSAFAAVLSQVPVQAVTQQHLCATCLIGRIAWENSHRTQMEAAMTAAAQAAGIEPGSPQAGQLDLGPFLPEGLQPGQRNGIPAVTQAVTTFQGNEVCALHAAQGAGVQPGRSPLLVATATMNPLGQLTGTG